MPKKRFVIKNQKNLMRLMDFHNDIFYIPIKDRKNILHPL